MDARTTLLAGVGTFATIAGLVVLAVPSVASLGPVGDLLVAVDSFGPHRLLLAAGLGLGGLLAIALRTPPAPAADEGDRFDRAVDHPPERVDVPEDHLAGSAIDATLVSAIEHGDAELETIRDHLRETAVSVYATRTGADTDVARRAVDQGDWCEDPIAATFLAAGGQFPLAAQLRLLALPERERRRRIDRTITAIEETEAPT